MTGFAAVDLGASGGRVMVGRVEPGTLDLRQVCRFANEPVRVAGTLHWDILALYRGVLTGLRAAGPVRSLGVDSWAVDYGLLDETGALLGNPVHYRDSRTDDVPARVARRIPEDRLYARTGVQRQPFNTLYQLVAAAGTPQLRAARRMLLVPDLIGYWLTGQIGAELTNASTTQLLDPATGAWNTGLIRDLALPPDLFPPLRAPGDPIGPVSADLLGYRTEAVAVGSHDTASAVVGVPAQGPDFAYVSCGTWSLVGVERDAPVLTEASRRANFTNERGVDGTVRFLRNVAGLWPLQESLRVWGRDDVATLLREAAREPGLAAVVDLDDPAFRPPGDMPARIAAACRASGQPEPATPAATVRCIVDSLALAHRRAVRQAQELSGGQVNAVHMVGGGARNELLCRLTADACGLPVLAGPAEATALGNILVQARAAGVLHGDLSALRALLRQTRPITRYEPGGDEAAWRCAERRVGG
ncbi:rhamnulokinase [Mangrovihabitans endophyticus]|uniref:Carbohydrate kinase n=1 Tax=Mangrovihabitans endophyticus TaxID=1751298 RepID=A0A8J3C577_9ACTN|nr:rhamnulokinase family protein [Mangrovihabitans endophyticus]GGL11201.1 carbohydrate kinase [Mangrovihabitans endophyticus]